MSNPKISFDKWSTLRAEGGSLVRTSVGSGAAYLSSYTFPDGETIITLVAISESRARVVTSAGFYIARAGDPWTSPEIHVAPLFCAFDKWSALKVEGNTLRRVTIAGPVAVLATHVFPDGEAVEDLVQLSEGRADVVTNKGGYMVRGKDPGLAPDINLVVIYTKD